MMKWSVLLATEREIEINAENLNEVDTKAKHKQRLGLTKK